MEIAERRREIMIRIKTCNYGEILDLPFEKHKLLALLDVIEDELPVKIFIEKVVFPNDLWRINNQCINLDDLDYLAHRLESLEQNELNKFYAIIGHEQTSDIVTMINLTFNLHTYTLIQDVSSMESIGMTHILTINRKEMICCELDVAEIGKKLLSEHKAIPTIYGLLFKNSLKFF